MIGLGAAGSRAARQLQSWPSIESLTLHDPSQLRVQQAVASLGGGCRGTEDPDEALLDCDVALLCFPGDPAPAARKALGAGAHVVSMSTTAGAASDLLALEGAAGGARRHVVVGAGFSPGLSELVAAHLAGRFDRLDEIDLAVTGSGGVACRQERMAGWPGLSGSALGKWPLAALMKSLLPDQGVLRWFPEPLGQLRCEIGSGAEELLLRAIGPNPASVTLHQYRSVGERVLSVLPSPLASRKPEADLGGLAVELRGLTAEGSEVMLAGAVDRPAVAAGTVAAVAAGWAVDGRLGGRWAGGVGTKVAQPAVFLAELARRGVKVAEFRPGSGETI